MHPFVWLLIILSLIVLTALYAYQFVGRKEFFKFDSVQFVYAFVVAPLLFVWFKSFLQFFLTQNTIVTFDSTQFFVLDTLLSVVLLYILMFVLLHSFTKTINLKVKEDPLFDIFHYSEYFHLLISHFVMYTGGLVLLTVLSIINAFIPFEIENTTWGILSLLALGVVGGSVIFVSVWLSDPKQRKVHFSRIMKVVFGILFLVHVVLFLGVQPSLNVQHGLFWLSSAVFTTMTTISLFLYRSPRAYTWLEWVSSWLKHEGWDFHLDLFKKERRK